MSLSPIWIFVNLLPYFKGEIQTQSKKFLLLPHNPKAQAAWTVQVTFSIIFLFLSCLLKLSNFGTHYLNLYLPFYTQIIQRYT